MAADVLNILLIIVSSGISAANQMRNFGNIFGNVEINKNKS